MSARYLHNLRPPAQPLLAIDVKRLRVRRYAAERRPGIAGHDVRCVVHEAEIPAEFVNEMGTSAMLHRLTVFRLSGDI